MRQRAKVRYNNNNTTCVFALLKTYISLVSWNIKQLLWRTVRTDAYRPNDLFTYVTLCIDLDLEPRLDNDPQYPLVASGVAACASRCCEASGVAAGIYRETK